MSKVAQLLRGRGSLKPGACLSTLTNSQVFKLSNANLLSRIALTVGTVLCVVEGLARR
jgi:hypothetical protein